MMVTWILILLIHSPYVGSAGTAVVVPNFIDQTSCILAGEAADEGFKVSNKTVSYVCIPQAAPKDK